MAGSNIIVNFLFGGNATSLQTAAAQANAALGSTNRSLIENRVRFLAATAVVSGFAAALTGTIASLIETSAEFQRLSTSFVSILAGPLLDAKNGAELTIENVKILRAESTGLFVDAQRAAVDTVATTKEYVSTLQAALAIGQAVGLNQSQIEELVHRLVIAAGQFGIEQEKVGTSIAQIFSGTVRATNQLGRNLGLGTVEARAQLKEAIKLGTVYDFLINKTKGFAATSKESANNFTNVAASIKDIFQIGGTTAFAPLFDFIRKQLVSIRDEFFGLGSDTPALKNLVAGFQDFFKNIIPSLIPLTQAIGNLFSTIGSRSSIINTTFKVILSVLTAIINLLAQAISLKGLGGFLVFATSIQFALKEAVFLLGPGLSALSIGFRNLANDIILATTATTAFGRASAILSVTNVFIRIATVVFIAIEAIKAFTSSTENAVAQLEKLTKQSELFKEQQDQFAKDRNLEDLISEYQRLSVTQDGTYKDAVRLAEVTNLLSGVFNANELAAIRAGKANAEIFSKGQSKFNQDLQERIKDLQKLKNAILELQKLPDIALSTESQVIKREALEKSINNLGSKLVPDYTTAQIANNQALNEFVKDIDVAIAGQTRQKESLSILTKSREDLFKAAYAASNLDQTSVKNQKKLAEVSGALQFNYLLQAKALGLTGRAAQDSAKAAVSADLAKTESSLITIKNIELENDLLAQQGKLYIFNQEEASPLGITTTDEQRKILEARKAELENLLAKFSTKAPAQTGKTSRGTANRDELKDFLAEVKRELDLLKSAADSIEKEATKITDANRKLIRELGDTGVIAFQDSIDLERSLIEQSTKLQKDLIQGQLDVLKLAEDVGEGVAKRTEERSTAAKAKFTDDKGKTRTVGGVGFDSRARRDELSKLITDEVTLLGKLTDVERKSQEDRAELVKREVDQKINLYQTKRQVDQQAIKDSEETLNIVEEQLAKLGLLASGQLLEGQIARSKADLARQRQDLVNQLFPLADPEIRRLLADSLKSLSTLLTNRGIAEPATKLFDQLINASGDPAKLQAFRETVAASIRDEGFLINLYTEKNDLLKKVTDAQTQLNEAEQASKDYLTGLGKGEKPNEKLVELRQKTIDNLRLVLAATSEQTAPEIDRINRVIDILEKVSLTKEQQLKVEEALNANKEKGKQLDITNGELVIQQKQKELELQFKLLDFNFQRLDILDQLNQKEQELGIKTKYQADTTELLLIRERERLLQTKRSGLSLELGAINPNVTPDSVQAEKRKQLQLDLANLDLQLFELKNKAFDLYSPLVALRDAFKDIGDSVSSLPEPFNKLKGVFTGIESLLNTIAGINRPKPPEAILQSSATDFQKAVDTFQKAVTDLQNFIASVSTASSHSANTDLSGIFGDKSGPHSLGGAGVAAGQAVEDSTKTKVAAIIRAAGKAVAGILGAIANKDLGQGISAFAGIAELIPVVGKFIGPALDIIGGVVSFFGAQAKKKTQELAASLTFGIQDLKDAISSGAIGLGQGIRDLQSKLEDARRQLSGKKGGADELKKIEDDIEAEKKRLRAEAKKVQDDFKAQLDLLRSPKGLRDTITAINAIADSAKTFIKSFENPQDALAAVKDAQEFVRISIQELKDDIQKSLTDLQQNLRDATDKFVTDERAILLEGRIDPRVSEAQSKRERLVALERDFQKNKLDLENQISAEQQKLDYVNQRNLIEQKIARLAQQSADSMGLAADKLSAAANSLESAFNAIQGFSFSGAGAGSTGNQVNNFTINAAPGQSPEQIGIAIQQHLEMAGQLSSSRLNRFNPTVRVN